MSLGSILRCADEWETALILTALNGAYYPIDCQRLLWSMIDFGKRTIRFDRSKTLGQRMQPVPRVAVLWRRTVSALDRIRNGSLHVFLSSTGSPVHIETIRKHWKRLCKTAGIERRLTFANLRDSALTAAAGSQTPPIPIHQYHILAGHVSRGVDDNYIRRNPRIVTLACEAIENRYFGNY